MSLVAHPITIQVDPNAHLVAVLSRVKRRAVE